MPQTIEPVPPAKYYRPCEEPYGERQSDLCAQWKAADSASNAAWWAQWQLVVSTLGLAGLFYTLYLTRRTVEEAQKSSEAAFDSIQLGKFGQRAWLVNSPPQIDLNRDKEGRLFVQISIQWRNSGQTPALDVMCVGGFAGETKIFEPEKIAEFRNTAARTAVGPGTSFGSPTRSIELMELFTKGGTVSLRSIVEYRDIFEPTVQRVSDVTIQLRYLGHTSPDKLEPEQIMTGFEVMTRSHTVI